MSYPREFVRNQPDKLAVIVEPGGQHLTYKQLEEEANRAAQLFRSLGLKPGDKVAFCLENCADIFVFYWGAQRSGLYIVPVSSRLTEDEISYILQDSDASLFLTSDVISTELDRIHRANSRIHLFKLGEAVTGFGHWRRAMEVQPADPIADECRGMIMFYSSGTTGRPKGIVPPSVEGQPIDEPDRLQMMLEALYGANNDTCYLCPAPLYHAAPLGYSLTIHRFGGTVVVMEKFDPAGALQLIEKHQISMAQFVPTHFVRMLKLDENQRKAAKTGSLKTVIHAAAPCPVPVKQAMIEWWGPVLIEYYAGSEGNGFTFIDSKDWLAHPGSVGRAVLGSIHICGEDGEELPAGEEGMVYFEGGNDFAYHNDPDKTMDCRNEKGWTTLGDIGKLDEEGYLYLTDRKSFMIISGGVNIYPQEIENHLITHPKVYDVAVIGAPDPDMGEKTVAVIQPLTMDQDLDALAAELDAFAREKLSGVKIPRHYDFRAELPRADTGKLYKRLLRDEYWQNNQRE